MSKRCSHTYEIWHQQENFNIRITTEIKWGDCSYRNRAASFFRAIQCAGEICCLAYWRSQVSTWLCSTQSKRNVIQLSFFSTLYFLCTLLCYIMLFAAHKQLLFWLFIQCLLTITYQCNGDYPYIGKSPRNTFCTVQSTSGQTNHSLTPRATLESPIDRMFMFLVSAEDPRCNERNAQSFFCLPQHCGEI